MVNPDPYVSEFVRTGCRFPVHALCLNVVMLPPRCAARQWVSEFPEESIVRR